MYRHKEQIEEHLCHIQEYPVDNLASGPPWLWIFHVDPSYYFHLVVYVGPAERFWLVICMSESSPFLKCIFLIRLNKALILLLPAMGGKLVEMILIARPN